ncbi:maleate cis-trans isomerase family protein [Mycolicibacterium frederiksbergense]|uniref:maleate cis-trans isomerase family protein n=1 Tax=Mycolicibacterium frederiksbergense TaxID=117567 RepID=UPI00265C7576|nr:Asp/Glu racemase [Mycolicibacterium frederiksbergense]MDO0978141.1 Asp/Glu racemase [Mycolicibacterium frederiksbergense]
MNPSPPLQQAGIGVVVPYDFALDRELWRWLPDDVSLHLTRMPFAPMPATMEMAVHISDPETAAQSAIDVSAVSPLVMAYACTSGSFVGGPAAERALVAAMMTAGAPAALTTSGALLAALHHLEITRIATATPYTADLTVGLTAFLGESGIEVTAAAGLGLISDIWTVPHDVTVQLVRETDTANADAVFISCTNMPTYDVIARLEAELHKPVLTANQVTMWHALSLVGRKAVGPGQQLMER